MSTTGQQSTGQSCKMTKIVIELAVIHHFSSG